MDLWLAADPPFFGGPGQGTRQIVELFVAFGLTALIGSSGNSRARAQESARRRSSARPSALILLVSKYGFNDVLQVGLVEVDPSRVAAQIVSGIGFLGAGIIIFRRGSVHGLTTAAAVWESAAIGMAAGSGLLLLAVTVTAMHFLVVVGFLPLARWLTSRLSGSVTMHVSYEEGQGVMTRLLQACERRQWQLTELANDTAEAGRRPGRGVADAVGQGNCECAGRWSQESTGVIGIHQYDDDPD